MVKLLHYISRCKQSREFGMQQDSCWALIGAMKLENVPVNYELPLDNIKMIFLTALSEKYHWTMLLLPQPSSPVSHGWWRAILDRLLWMALSLQLVVCRYTNKLRISKYAATSVTWQRNDFDYPTAWEKPNILPFEEFGHCMVSTLRSHGNRSFGTGVKSYPMFLMRVS